MATESATIVTSDAMTVTPLTGSVGARIDGVDLRQLSDAQFAEIHAAFLSHCMLVFRGQALRIEDHLDFAQRWGELSITPMVNYIDGYPGVLPLSNRGKEREINENWHSDSTFMAQPPKITILVARDIPPAGGDTMWNNQYLAYETLSDGMKRLLEGVRAKFTGTRLAKLHNHQGEIPSAYHPVVRTHPETGRKALYLNVGHTTRFVDMTVEESAPLLDFLFEHLKRPEFCCALRWEPGTMALWDNRCAQHYPVNDYHGHRRVMHRITLKGVRPV